MVSVGLDADRPPNVRSLAIWVYPLGSGRVPTGYVEGMVPERAVTEIFHDFAEPQLKREGVLSVMGFGCIEEPCSEWSRTRGHRRGCSAGQFLGEGRLREWVSQRLLGKVLSVIMSFRSASRYPVDGRYVKSDLDLPLMVVPLSKLSPRAWEQGPRAGRSQGES